MNSALLYSVSCIAKLKGEEGDCWLDRVHDVCSMLSFFVCVFNVVE